MFLTIDGKDRPVQNQTCKLSPRLSTVDRARTYFQVKVNYCSVHDMVVVYWSFMLDGPWSLPALEQLYLTTDLLVSQASRGMTSTQNPEQSHWERQS